MMQMMGISGNSTGMEDSGCSLQVRLGWKQISWRRKVFFSGFRQIVAVFEFYSVLRATKNKSTWAHFKLFELI